MIDRWFSTIKIPMTFRQFEKLPRNPAYKYEYLDGETWLTPRPKQYHAMLELRRADAPARLEAQNDRVAIRPLVEADWEHLPPLFARAFARVQPFASLSDKTAVKAAESCLDQTRDGGDGPLIGPACLVAQREEKDSVVGAILVTNMADVDLTDFSDMRWREPPPPDWLERRLGRPHLTWIFVHGLYAGHGVGTALLGTAANALLDLGYDRLATTFLLGNESSMLWHWRNGFQLLAYPASHRQLRERYASQDRSPATKD